MLAILYVLSVSCTLHRANNDESVPVQTLPQFVHGAPDEIDQLNNVWWI